MIMMSEILRYNACMRQTTIKKRIAQIKRELQALGSMRPGSLSRHYTVCGKPGCRCVDPRHPRKHGPYTQLSYVHQGKNTTEFVRAPFIKTVRGQLATYKRFRALIEEWVSLALAEAKHQMEELKREG